MPTESGEKRITAATYMRTAAESVTYLRVSTARQATDGVGIESQRAKCRQHCERMGWTIGAEYVDEAISGKDGLDKRPGLAAMVDHCRRHDTIAVVYSVSRLARSQRLLWTLLDERGDYRLRLSSATESFDTTTPTGKAMLGMLAVFSQLEADMISERTKDALAELKSQGKVLGAPSAAMLVPPDTLDTIVGLWRTGQHTTGTIAAALNTLRVPAPKGGAWWPKSVRSVLVRSGNYAARG